MKKLFWLASLFLSYTLLSWVVFFRDERALMVIGGRFYPQLGEFLSSTRQTLIMLKLNTVPTMLFGLFLLGAFWMYFKTLKEKVLMKTVLAGAVIFQAITFFSYPILSTDVLSYILSDRVAVVYKQNVWQTPPDEFKTDPYFGLADWTEKTRIYGGVNQAIYSPVTSLTTQLFGDDLAVNLVTHKLVVLVFVVATMLLLARFFPASAALAIFWNPLLVLETAGSGHNDILMLFFVVLTILAFKKQKLLLAGLALGMATQVKTTPILLFVFMAAHLLSRLEFKKLVVFSAAFLITLLTVYYLMGVNPVYTITRMAGSISVYWQSLPMQINNFFPALKPFLFLGLLTFLGYQGIRGFIKRTDPVVLYGQTLLVYLLFFLAAYWNWYPIWLLVLVPFLTKAPRLKTMILALTTSSMLAYVVYWTALRFNYHLWFWPVIMYLTVISGPIFIWLKNIKQRF